MGEGRRAGHDFWDLCFFGVFRFAFKAKKGSPETRRMVIGDASLGVGVVGALPQPLLAAARDHDLAR